ncbi:MAG: peptide ABC transporter substrate-binding protein [Dehalococcoidia bacterium]
MSNRLTLGIVGVAAVLVLALAGFLVLVVAGGDDDDDGSTTSGQNGEEPGNDDGDGDDDGDDSEPASGELRLRGEDPLVLDPAIAQDAGSANYIVEIFSGLVRLDTNLDVQPDVAERYETSDDGTVYTFHLHPSASFQDGRPVLAEDVKYSFERALNPDTGSIVAENFLGDIVGARDVSRGRATELSGLRVVDDATVEITIDAPKPYFIYKLTYPTAFIVDERQITANPSRWTQKPNGTGPYELGEWRLGERIVLQAYERHHLGPPKLKTVRFELSGGSSLVAYQDGDIDVTGIGLDDLSRIQDPGDPLHAEYVETTQQLIDYIGFNVNVPPFDDPDVRRAFALAIDRQKIAEVILEDAIPVANGIIPPGVPGHTDEDKTFPYDPERARQLIAGSQYGNDLPEITLAESGAGATVGPTTEAIVQMWRDELGVDVRIQHAESGTFFSDVDQGRYQMFHLGWIMDYPDPENVLDLLFHGESRQNNTRYDNPDVNAKLEQARVEQDSEARLRLYQEVERTLIEDAAWVPLFFDRSYILVKPYVQGFTLPPTVVERFRDVEVNR